MTISYTGDVANASDFGCFNKILLKWKGSVYKLIYKELLAYLILYMLLNLVYRNVIIPNSHCPSTPAVQNNNNGTNCKTWQHRREVFESIVTYCHHQMSSIPLTFVLGFYVSLIVARWWTQYTLLPWPDTMAMLVISFLTGKEERQRLMRRNIIRYVLLSYCMATRAVSFRVKKRFPDLQHLVDAGLMREDEYKVLDNLDGKVTANKWFLPLVWAADICSRALAEGKVRPQTIRTLIGELCNIREKLTGIMNHDWVSVPLVYTQTVTLAVYFYFTAALIGAQWINPVNEDAYEMAYDLPIGDTGARLDMCYPFFLTIQFAFFFGWLKVAETLINPFGEDDDDFELNRLIDRHCQVGYLIVEHDETPELLQDKYWEMIIPQDIPYTLAAEKYKAEEFVGSAEATLQVKESEKVYADVKTNVNIPKLQLNGIDLHTEDRSTVASGIYEEVGTPLMNKVALITRKMALLGSMQMGSMRSIHSAASSGANSQVSQARSRRKSQMSLYDKISRNLSLFDTSSNHSQGGGGGRIRRKSRQRSVSDVVKPQLDELSVATSVVNEAFECEDEKKDLESVIDIEPNTLSYLIERRRLSTIDENLDSPNLTLASHKNVEQKQHIKFLFDEAEEEVYNQEVFEEVKQETYNKKELVNSSDYLFDEAEEEIYNQEILVVDNPDNSDEEVSGKFTSPIFV